MSLALRAGALSPDKYEVMHGEWQIGQIYKRSFLYAADEQWIWAFDGVPAGGLKQGICLAGNAGTREEAEVALKESWQQWLVGKARSP